MVAAAPALTAVEANSKNPLARRWWLNLALLAVVIGLGTYAWLRPEKKPDADKPALTALPAESVRAIEIARRGEPVVQLERHDSGWRLTAPIKARADAFAVEQLLRVLSAPVENIAPAEGGLARYGLDQPRLVLRFDATELRFGDVHPLKDEYYVQYGERLYLVSSRHYAQAAAPYASLIDSRLLEAGRKPVAFKLPDFTLTLKDGEWQRDPRIEALSSDRINGFVDDWRHARALEVEKYSGKKPQQSIVITTEGQDGGRSDVVVAVLARQPQFILYRPDEGLEYHFPEDTAKRLLELNEPPSDK